ncbi:MAG: arginine--tRNA ligase [Acidobacteria bacterium]|nr:MAG: arginine--tRNA ligase [Acidobacteriota bacterium]
MKALSPESIVGEALESVYREVAAAIAAASRGALEPEQVVLVPAPAHTGCDLAFQCFKLARAWRQAPPAIAAEMATRLAAPEGDLLASAEAAGPYLNLRLDRDAVAARVLAATAAAGDEYGHSRRQQGEVVMMEYVSPNTNKPLHLGHLRNAVLGRAVIRLIAAQGARTYTSDIINDRGIHIAKSMVAYQRWGEGKTPQEAGIKGDHFVGRLYVRFSRALDDERRAWLERQGIDPSTLDERARKKVEERFQQASELMGEARDLLRRWEDEDPEVRALWRRMNRWVYDGFEETYRKLGITFDKHYYESEIYQGGKEIILEALEKGIFERAPNGAVVAPLSKHFKLQDKTVLRADGTGLYVTQDINLAAIKFRDFGLTRSIYCIGSEQDYYMKQLFAILKLLGFPWAEGLHHLSYGMVYLPEGKMKSREGRVVDADDLIAGMSELAEEALRERHGELDDEERERRALAIALAAMTFHFLVVGRDTEIHFDPASSLAFEGKTGPYLQYATARVASILRKAGDWQPPVSPVLHDDLEWRLVFALLLFPTVVADAADSLDPSRLANHLVDLAQSFSTFYHDLPVLAAEEPLRASRLALVQAVGQTLKNGLRLLGIEPLEVM